MRWCSAQVALWFYGIKCCDQVGGARDDRRRGKDFSGVGRKRVVPVVGRGPQSFDCGMQLEHLASCCIAGVIGIESAVDFVTAGKQSAEPARIRSHTRSGDADSVRLNLVATDGVDG